MTTQPDLRSGVGGGVLALDIGGTKLAAGIGWPGGALSREAGEPTRPSDGAPRVLERAIALARRCHDEEIAAGGEIRAIGVATMGLTRSDSVELAPNVPGWDRLRIPAALRTALPGLPVAIDNDVKAATRAEMTWGALRGVDDGIYLNLGTGIAAGIVAGGRLVRGGHGAAGEIGYSVTTTSLDGPVAADGSAPFEERFGGAGAARRLAGTGLPGSVAEVVALGPGHHAAGLFLDDLWTGIAALVADLCIALDPTVLAVGGGYVRGDSDLLPRLRQIVGRAVPHPPSVVAAHFGADASLRGAVAVALTAAGEAP